jgi:hypothetical protein
MGWHIAFPKSSNEGCALSWGRRLRGFEAIVANFGGFLAHLTLMPVSFISSAIPSINSVISSLEALLFYHRAYSFPPFSQRRHVTSGHLKHGKCHGRDAHKTSRVSWPGVRRPEPVTRTKDENFVRWETEI